MKPSKLLLSLVLGSFYTGVLTAQEGPAFSLFQVQPNREVRLRLAGAGGVNYRIDAADESLAWTPLTLITNINGTVEFIDSATPFLAGRIYRAAVVPGSTLTGDFLPTDDGDVVIHPVFHATMVLQWKGVVVCVDPTNDTLPQLRILPKADIVLITHHHGDHYNANAISTVVKPEGKVYVSRSVYPLLPANLQALGTMLENDQVAEVLGVTIKAVPAYNGNHPTGDGNGYVVTFGGKNLYISGDTDDVAEMRALQNIDVAFVCMDAQFNMNMAEAASAVREFRPRIVYPYHYNAQNPATFKQSVGTDLGIEVRLRKWQ